MRIAISTKSLDIKTALKTILRFLLWGTAVLLLLEVGCIGYNQSHKPSVERKLAMLNAQGYSTTMEELSETLPPPDANTYKQLRDLFRQVKRRDPANTNLFYAAIYREHPPFGGPYSDSEVSLIQEYVTPNLPILAQIRKVIGPHVSAHSL